MPKHQSSYKFIWLFAALTMVACTPDQQVARTDSERGKAVYATRCAQCHGAAGEGAGPASLGLGAPPPSLRLLTANNNNVFPRDYVMSTIDGLARHDHPTAAMPEFGDGNLGQLIQVEENGLSVPIPAELLALANYLETIQD